MAIFLAGVAILIFKYVTCDLGKKKGNSMAIKINRYKADNDNN